MNILAIIRTLWLAINPTTHNNLTTLLQDALNVLYDLGVITLPAELNVDGIFGLTTFAAFKQLQDKIGLSFMSAEPFASIEYNLLVGFLNNQATLTAKLGDEIHD